MSIPEAASRTIAISANRNFSLKLGLNTALPITAVVISDTTQASAQPSFRGEIFSSNQRGGDQVGMQLARSSHLRHFYLLVGYDSKLVPFE